MDLLKLSKALGHISRNLKVKEVVSVTSEGIFVVTHGDALMNYDFDTNEFHTWMAVVNSKEECMEFLNVKDLL